MLSAHGASQSAPTKCAQRVNKNEQVRIKWYSVQDIISELMQYYNKTRCFYAYEMNNESYE